jgi:O-antigen/teichoic acid export membrane protein
MSANEKSVGHSLAIATLVYGIGSYVPQLINFLLTPLYTHLISIESMGVLEIVLSVQMLAFVVGRFGLPGAVQRLWVDGAYGGGRTGMVSAVFWATVVTSVVVTASLALLAPIICRLLELPPDSDAVPMMRWAMLAVLLQVAPEIQKRLLQIQKRVKEVAALNALQAVTITVLNVLLIVVFEKGVMGIILSGVIASGLFAVIAITRNINDYTSKPDMKALKDAVKYGAPLMPSHVGGWLQSYGMRFVAQVVASTVVLGQVAIAARLISPIAVVTSAFSAAYVPIYFEWRAREHATKDSNAIEKIAQSLYLLGALVVIGASTIGAWFVRHVLAPGYEGGAFHIGFLSLASFGALIYTLWSCEIFYSKRTEKMLLIFIPSSLLTLFFTWAAARIFGSAYLVLGQVFGSVATLILTWRIAGQSHVVPLRKEIFIPAVSIAFIASFSEPCRMVFLDAGDWKRNGIYAAVTFLVMSVLLLRITHTQPLAIARALLASRRMAGSAPPAAAPE